MVDVKLQENTMIFIGNRQILSLIPLNTLIDCDGYIIYPSTHVKNLGVYVDKCMLFDVHINEVKGNGYINVHQQN